MATYTENDYRGVSLKMDDVFIPPNKCNPTPSELDNLDPESENMLRILGCESIQDAGKLLKLPQVAVACAQVLYHRFYFSKSFVRHNWEHYAMACVFLSAKIEESCRKLRDVVTVFVHLRQLREQSVFKPLPIPEYAELKPHIIKAERRILKELGFCVHGKHPHKLICIYLHFLGQAKNSDLTQLSWNYMNDSLRTTVFACYQPETIAVACIYLASLHLQLPLGTSWYEIFNVTEETVQTISRYILKLYSHNKPDVTDLEKRVTHLRKAQIEARNQKIAIEKREQQDVMTNNNGAGATASSGDHHHRRHSSKASRKAGDGNNSNNNIRDRDRDGHHTASQDRQERRDVGQSTKGKENLEKSSSRRKKAHKSRKSPSPSPPPAQQSQAPTARYDSRRYRSRSPKKTRDHSPEKSRKNHKKYGVDKKDYVSSATANDSKKYRRSYDSDDEYNSDKRRRPQLDYNNSKEYLKPQRPSSPNSSSSTEQRRHRKRQQRSSSPPPSSNYMSKLPAGSSKHSGGSRKVQNGGKLYR